MAGAETGDRWHRARSTGCTWSSIGPSLKRSGGSGCGSTRPARPARLGSRPPTCIHPARRSWPHCWTRFATTARGLHAYLCLAVSTGARRSQLLALRWVDIDEPRSAIGFQRALVEGPGGPVLQATKTHRTYRVDLDQSTLEVLVAHRRAAETVAREAGAEMNLDGFVFSSDGAGSTPWRPNSVTKQFIAARRAANLSHFRLHDLRHFMATQMLTAGVPIATVAHRLSHARASTTLNVYAHAVPGGDRRAAEALAAIVEAARVPPAPGSS